MYRKLLRGVALALSLAIVLVPIGARVGTAAPGSKAEADVGDQPGYVPSPDEEKVAPEYRPQPVFFRTDQPPGSIVIHTDERFLYLIQGNGRAIRYGIGVGRVGFQWQGMLQGSRQQQM